MPPRPPALGATVPDSPHATVLSLPTLDDIVSYERKEPRVWSLIRAGYPRFVRNALVTEAAEELARRCAFTPDSEGLPPGWPDPPWSLFPLAREDVARRLAAQAGAPPRANGVGGAGILLIVESGPAADRLAKLVQHTGALISSRQAEAWLADEPEAPDTGSAEVRAALAPFFPGVAPADLLLCSSGMNAVDAALHAVDVVQSPAGRRAWIQLGWLYVDSIRLLEKNPGVERRFVHDVTDLAAVERLLAAGDVAGVLTEAPNNPQLQTADLSALRALCDRHGALLVVDPSSAGVAATDVLPHADLVACSLTKYAASAGDVMAGALAVNPARPHAAALLKAARPRHIPLHALDAAALAPQVAKVAEVTARLSANAAELARRLEAHPSVVRVRTALTGPTADHYRRIMRPGAGGGALVTVELREGLMRGVYDRLDLVKGPSFGLSFTVAAPFMWLAHFDEVTSEKGRADLRAAGLDPDLLRVSVGLEPVDVVWEAFRRALG
ncbi:MAG: aminotransferase class I/II-fold pyridoxal phosphate-dependent enzyme [Opitutales bacterium]